jgi:hypothetical protein
MATAHDKHQHELAKGDRVEVVHFGEHHNFTIEEIHEDNGHFYLTGSILIRVPALACTTRKDEKPKDAPRQPARPVARKPELPTPHDTIPAPYDPPNPTANEPYPTGPDQTQEAYDPRRLQPNETTQTDQYRPDEDRPHTVNPIDDLGTVERKAQRPARR